MKTETLVLLGYDLPPEEIVWNEKHKSFVGVEVLIGVVIPLRSENYHASPNTLNWYLDVLAARVRASHLRQLFETINRIHDEGLTLTLETPRTMFRFTRNTTIDVAGFNKRLREAIMRLPDDVS